MLVPHICSLCIVSTGQTRSLLITLYYVLRAVSLVRCALRLVRSKSLAYPRIVPDQLASDFDTLLARFANRGSTAVRFSMVLWSLARRVLTSVPFRRVRKSPLRLELDFMVSQAAS